MKKIALAAAAASVMFAGAASAADLPVSPYPAPPPVVATAIYNWGGAYIGINGGWGTSHRTWDNVTTGVSFSDGSHDANGGIIGGHIGYRYQATYLVVGVEGQGDWADLTGSHVSLLDPTTTIRSRIDGLGLFTAHAGYAWNNVLLYARGGFAVAHNKYDFFGGVNGTASETRWGGTIGVGLEVGFAPNWSVGVNYDHLFLNRRDISLPGGLFAERVNGDVDMVTARVSYRFGGPVYAKY